MVFLDWKELPWYWHGFQHFGFAAADVDGAAPGCSRWCSGGSAFRSRIRGVYFSIVTQALTYAATLLFFQNATGFGGNNGLTDFKRISRLAAAPSEHARRALRDVGDHAGRDVRALPLRRDESPRPGAAGRPRRRAQDPLLAATSRRTTSCSSGRCRRCCAAWPARSTSPRSGIINPSEMQPANSIEMAIWWRSAGAAR